MAKPADYTTPQLDATWAHYGDVRAACPFMNDTAEDISGLSPRSITITNPNSQIEWYTGSHGRGLRKTGSTAGNTIAYESLLGNNDAGTLIAIYSVETSAPSSSYFLSGSYASLTRWSSDTLARTNLRNVTANSDTTGDGGANAGRFMHADGGSGERVIVLSWDAVAGRRYFWQNSSGWIDGSGDPIDAYTADFAPGSVDFGSPVRLLSQSTGEGSATGLVLTGIVSLNVALTQAQAKAIFADPWAWVEDGGATNTAPVFAGTIANLAGTVGAAISSTDVSSLFSDADEDALTYSEGGTWPARDGGGSWVHADTGVISGTISAGETPGTFASLTIDASDGTDSVSSNEFSFVVNAAGDVPTITGVSAAIVHGQPLTITGTNLADATVSLDYSTVSIEQTITTQTETDIVIAAIESSNDLPYGTVTLTVTEAAVGTATRSVSHLPAAGLESVTVDVPWADTADSIFEGDTPTAAVDGDQIEYEITTHRGNDVIVRADGTLRVAEDTKLHLFNVRIWDESALEWGVSTVISVRPDGYVGGLPSWVGPDIEDQSFAPDDAVSINAALFEDDDDDIAGYSLSGEWPDWASIDNAGLITGTAGDDAVYSDLYVTATDSLGNEAVSNTFSITVETPPPPPPPYADVDRIIIQNQGSSKRWIYRLSGLELRARFADYTGTLVYPRDTYWKVVNCDTGQTVLDWQALEIQSEQDEFDAYTDIYGDLEVSGLLHDVSRDTRFAVQVVADKGAEREFSTSWEYTVKFLVR